jgi:hypothetical protein
MSQMTDTSKLTATVRTCQILVASLIAGVVFFLALVVLVISPALNPAPGPAGAGGGPAPGAATDFLLAILTYLAVGFGLVVLILSFVIPRLGADQARRQIAAAKVQKPDLAADTAKLVGNYQTQLIIREAMLEGGAFFAGVAYMLNQNPIALLTAVILLAVIAMQFPTSHRVRAWIDDQLGRLQDDRLSAV